MKKILVVDDNLTTLKLVGAQLAGTYRVILAKSGPQALAIAAREILDMVILDIEMPEMDGFATLAALRGNPSLCHLPVIFLSADHDAGTQARALAAGGVDYLEKPVEKEALLDRIGLHLRVGS